MSLPDPRILKYFFKKSLFGNMVLCVRESYWHQPKHEGYEPFKHIRERVATEAEAQEFLGRYRKRGGAR